MVLDYVPPQPKPVAAIFLDIDGVLIGDRFVSPLHTLIREKLIELFGIKKQDWPADFKGYTELEWRIAASHFLSQHAVANLEYLIEKISLVAQVVIVLSSAWRMDGSLDEIKNQMFVIWPFSKYIFDKIPDDESWRYIRGEPLLSPIALEKYGFEFTFRANQIDFWLREHDCLQIRSFVVLDDDDGYLSERFPCNFVHVRGGELSQADIEKAQKIILGQLTQLELVKAVY